MVQVNDTAAGLEQGQVKVVHQGAYLQCATYQLSGSNGAVLVDAGGGWEEEAVLAGIVAARCGPADVRAILLTHAHADHALGAGALARRLDAPLVASAHAAEWLGNGDRRIWIEHPAMIRKATVGIRVADGEILELAGLKIECLATPGHTDGCMSYLVETAAGLAAFTGDLLMADPRHPGWAGGEDFSVEKSLASLELLLAREVRVAYTGHGAVPGDAREWLRRGIAHGRQGEWVLLNTAGAPTVPAGMG